jgi:hypothetical protein
LARLPAPRGPITEYLFSELQSEAHELTDIPLPVDDALAGDDFHLALYSCYELHYAGWDGVDEMWEWEPSLLALRRRMEFAFEVALRSLVPRSCFDPAVPIPRQLKALEAEERGPALSRFIQNQATETQAREFVMHRSAYQLKEADPHTWAIPRFRNASKAAMVEIQYDEYGSGRGDRLHSALFQRSMDALGLDPTYGAYLERIPGVTLATVNLMSFLGLQRRFRGASVGHLAMFEMSSPIPNKRYAAGLRRLGFDGEAVEFFDEHVLADSVHETIALHDLAGGLAKEEPDLAPDIMFGATALVELEARFATHLVTSWSVGRTSLYSGADVTVG